MAKAILSTRLNALLIASTFLSTPAMAQDEYAVARQAIQAVVAKHAVPSISVAVFSHGRFEWEESFGWADRDRKIEATPHTPYSLASISKSFTATALMSLVQSKRIDLDKPINEYLGSAKLVARVGNANAATVLRVADHTAGLPFHADFFYADKPGRRPPMDVTIQKYGQLTNSPGDRYFYSNLGYGILGYVVAREEGEDFAHSMQQLVFKPLDLRETYVGPPGQRPAAIRYQASGKLLADFETDHAGASEVYSSAHDLIRFAAFHLKAHLPDQKPILADADLDHMHQLLAKEDETSGYGIGFEVSERNGYHVIAHSGAMPGAATEMIMIPSEDLAVVVLTNTWASDDVDSIVDKIIATKLPRWTAATPGGFPAATKDFKPPADLVGRWKGSVLRSEGNLQVEIVVGQEGSIIGKFGDQAAVPLQKLSYKDGRLSGFFLTSLQTKDSERYQYVAYLDLKLDGRRLYGSTIALDDPTSQTFVAGLAHWTDLHHES